jgi:DNA-directed RNA polymerase subunit K/omega
MEPQTSGEKYMIVNVISKRVRELYRGAKPLVEKSHSDEEAEYIALHEFEQGKLSVTPKKPPEKLIDIAQRE